MIAEGRPQQAPFEAIQELILQSAASVSRHDLSEGFTMCKTIVKSLTADLQSPRSGQGMPPPVHPLPMNNGTKFHPFPSRRNGVHTRAAMPSYMDEIFCLPFTITVESESEQAQPEFAKHQEIVGACASVCLFNMGLCTQLEAMRDGGQGNNGKALRTARICYTRAWSCLRIALAPQDIGPDTPSDAMFLLMAISTNIAMCSYYLGDLDGYNEWFQNLEALVTCTQVKMDNTSNTIEEIQLRDFFLMTCAVNARCIAASAA